MPKYGFINLEKEVDSLLREYGYWLALRSVDLSKRTKESIDLVPGQYDQDNPDFQKVLSSYTYTDKLIKGYRYLAQPGFDFQTQVGVINTKLRVFIIEADKMPKNTDYILELELDETTGIPVQPFSVRRVWSIQDAEPLRAGQPVSHAGGIEFFRCFVEENNLGYQGRIT